MSFTVVAPITPGLMRHFALGSAASIGFASSAFALGRFLTTSLWPLASDYLGRRRVLCIALLGGSVGAALQGAAITFRWSFLAFLLVRGLTGMFSSIAPVVKAYIFDAFDKDDVPSVLAYREAAGTLAFVFGPMAGGALATRCFASPFYFAAGAGASAAFLAWGHLEAVDDGNAGAGSKSRKSRSSSSSGSAATGEKHKSSRRVSIGTLRSLFPLLLLSFVWACTRTCFHAYFPLMLATSYELSTYNLGVVLTSVSVLIAAVQIGGFDAMQRRCGVAGTLALGGLLVAAGLAGLGLAIASLPLPAVLLCSAVYGVGVALMSPAMPALLMQAITTPEHRGLFLGIESAVVNFGRIVAPPIYGLFVQQGSLPLSAVATGLATTLVWWREGEGAEAGQAGEASETGVASKVGE